MIAAFTPEPPSWRGPLMAIVASFCVLLACAMIFGDDALDQNGDIRPTSSTPWPDKPDPGLSVKGKVVEVYDGDTLTVEVRWSVRVRLLDCWAAEVRSLDAGEKRRGLAAKSYAQGLAQNKECTLWIPASEIKTLGDLTTMGRVLGHVWIDGDQTPLSRRIVDAGHATRARPTRVKEGSGG